MLDILLVVMTISAMIISFFTDKTVQISQAALTGCNNAVQLCITLAGSMALWGGIMRIAEKCGITKRISSVLSKPLSLLFKGLKGSRTLELISLNTAANLLGLGNAATPLGLKAMSELKKNGYDSSRHSAMFILLNTASIQLVPVTVAALRQSHGSLAPWEIMLPTVLTSLIALTAGIVIVNILYPKGDAAHANDRSCNHTTDDDSCNDKESQHYRKLLRGSKGKPDPCV